MTRPLIKSSAFARTAKQMSKKNKSLATDILATLETLSENAFHPSLKTHKLKGNLEGSWACSVAHDVRLIFEFIQHDGKEAILLAAIGSYHEVY
uniref:mRNA-degrading endonuclease (mRNA interferase) YafQ, toxin component of the YafQ-DinJ toxin-antitoxin module n=1 Tax=Candidatus Kentrum sp. FW TaxID=2126338 RepID=A0A450SNV3_9GAMM|nr:MAG: mRNA-degrading endonuclease (mRNA interferase) YafQ, toxin component of the YafQ-DinJ toxin-antitoxin module [Candidatus Kentron sp. FW]